MSQLRVALLGGGGRMGQAVAELVASRDDLELTAAVRHGELNEQNIAQCDVVIDFSAPNAAEEICARCVQHAKPAVLGTTGHTAEQRAAIERASKSVPIVFSANFSLGVNALFWLTRKAAEMLGETFNVEIIETHHRFKKDAPSGTAKRLAGIITDVRQLDSSNIAHGREGLVGERPGNEIGMHAIRAGDVVGEHTVLFGGAGERLELTHKAASRETFAIGALRAARWVVGRPPGLYSMQDVLGL